MGFILLPGARRKSSDAHRTPAPEIRGNFPMGTYPGYETQFARGMSAGIDSAYFPRICAST